MQRRLCLGMGMLTVLGLAAGGALTGCSGGPTGESQEMGTLSMPLTTHGPSGTEYRLRNAVFQIQSEYDYYDDDGAAGAAPGGSSYTLSSEDDPTASSLNISVERGYYYVRLQPGWHMEKVVGGVATEVEAQLLSGSTQWVWVSANSTSWVEYQFGIGGRELWFNGNLNINLQVYENPDEYFGGSYGGDSGTGGSGGSGGWAGEPQGAGGV
jgi:hypothetical protein